MTHTIGLVSLLLMAPQPSPPLEAVMDLLRGYESLHPGKTLTIAELLQALPQYYRESFALMHSSRSLQGSNPLSPRVLLFGEDGRLIITFNGDARQPGYNHLELAAVYDDAIHFHRLEFPAGDSGIGRVELSTANPPQCMTCHGPVPHFIWADYATWPGAYGARDDVLVLQQPGGANDRPLANETKWFETFRTTGSGFCLAFRNGPYG